MKQQLLALFLTTILISSCSSTDTRQLSENEKAQLYIEAASGSLNDGDAIGALRQLREAEKLDANNHFLQYLFALTYHKKNEMDLAIRSAKKSLEIEPDFSPAKNALGKFLLDRNDFNRAEKLLLEAANDLTYREAYLAKTNLGILYTKKKNPIEAEIWFDKAIQDAGSASCTAFLYRGEIHFNENNLEKAKEDFKRGSINFCARSTESHLALGKTLLKMNQTKQAKAKFIEIQQLFPSSEAATKANQYLKEIQ